MTDRWWMRTPRRPGLVLAAAMLAALVVSAGITMILTAGGGSHRPQAAGAGLGIGVPAPGTSPAGPSTGPGSTSPAPSRGATAHPTPPSPRPGSASGPASLPGKRTPPASPTGAPTPPAPPSPSPSPSSSPAQGYLLVAPSGLLLSSKAGQPASGFFVLTAANGPVAQYTVRVAAKAGRVSVAPASGSLPLDGFVEVNVTVTSKTALSTQVVVEPGNLSVTVVYKPKPKPAPTPTPSTGGGGKGG
jgi:hypothetical protein